MRAWSGVCAGATAVVLCGGAASASAAPAPDYEIPFLCGSEWTGSTRSYHSPSSDSVDFNGLDDLGAPTLVTAPGVVTRVADLGGSGYGTYVIIEHGSGHSSLYAHLRSAWVVEGQRVDQGALVGLVGESGNVSGPHLHFEQRVDGSVVAPYFHQERYSMPSTEPSRNCADVPLTGDWDGDGAAEVGVFRRGMVARFRLYDDSTEAARPAVVRYQRSSDQPVAGDWDGDGTTEVGVRRPGWRTFLLRGADGSTTQVPLGRVRDVPVTGDWDGDRTTDLGVWNPARGRFTLRSADGTLTRIGLGSTDDLPLSGDWNRDGVTDLGVFDPSTGTFTLRTKPVTGTATLDKVRFGTATSLPVTGDWNGNGVTDLGVWEPATRTFSLRTTPRRPRGIATVTTQEFGRARFR